jgi:hypothetical protein
MPSSKNAVVLVVITFLIVSLIFSSLSVALSVTLAKPKQPGQVICGLADLYGKVRCCQQTDVNDEYAGSWCTICTKTAYDPAPHDCGPRYCNGSCESTLSLPPGAINPPIYKAPPTATYNPPSSNNNTLIFNPPPTGNAANPSNNTSPTGGSNTIKAIRGGAFSPTGYCSRFATTTCIPCDPGLPGGRDNCIPTSDWPPPSTFKNNIGPGLGTATNRLGNAPIPSGNATNSGNTGIVGPLQQLPQTQQPPSTPPSTPSSQKQQTLTTTCPDGSAPDANGNCPTSSTNQQGGSTSNNNNPTPGHHKGSNNQPTQTGGGQQLTATKKHKGSKTDQGTTVQPPS